MQSGHRFILSLTHASAQSSRSAAGQDSYFEPLLKYASSAATHIPRIICRRGAAHTAGATIGLEIICMLQHASARAGAVQFEMEAD